MFKTLRYVLLLIPVLMAAGCSSSSNPPAADTASANFALFDPSASNVPLPNILATVNAKDPMMNYSGNYGSRPANKPMNPAEALAYINKYEMGSTNAVAGLNAPIYIRFAGAVDPATVSPGTIKVFQLSIDSNGLTENGALGFTDISTMFDYTYSAGSTQLHLYPKFPLLPGTRYMYVVTSGVKDAATGGSLSGSFYFEALKSTTPLLGAFSALEAIRANVYADAPTNSIVKLSGYAKVMDDMITASATTKISSRNQIALLGRFITTGAGFISKDGTGSTASMIPVESALRAFAAGSTPSALGGLSGKAWANSVGSVTTYQAPAYWTAVGAGAAPSSVDSVATGTIESADLSIDPVVVKANSATIDLTGNYNPAAGVVQPFRDSGGALTGYYHSLRNVPFVYFKPATTPNGEVVIFQHGIGGQKEHAVAVAQTLTTAGYAVIAIDLPLHGALAAGGQTTSTAWAQSFMAVGAPLATRSNIQQAAFNLNRLELTMKLGGLVAAGITTAAPTKIHFAGISLGSIVGAYYLAGNTGLSTGTYNQSSLSNDMKGFLSVPGGRLAYLLRDSATFSSSINNGLLAKGIAVGTPTYNQFFQITQTIVDTVDPATMTTPLPAAVSSGLSRLSGRVAIQEAVGDQVIPNPNTRYFGNALGGRGVLGSIGALVAPGFKQLGYRGGSTPTTPAQFMYALDANAAVTAKIDFAAALNATTTSPAEGYFQFNQADIHHAFLVDPRTYASAGAAATAPTTASSANTYNAQVQMVNFLLRGAVVDPVTTTGKIAAKSIGMPEWKIAFPASYEILGY